jgi:uncharacterized protein YxjI
MEANDIIMLNDRKQFCVRQKRIGFKLYKVFDIYDFITTKEIGLAVEENSLWINIMRFFLFKMILPNRICIYESESDKLFLTMTKPFKFNILNRVVFVRDAEGDRIGELRHSMIGLKRQFSVYNHDKKKIGFVKGDLKGWNFKFEDNSSMEIVSIKKKWTEIGNENYSSNFNYSVSIEGENKEIGDVSRLVLASTLAIEMMFKEN